MKKVREGKKIERVQQELFRRVLSSIPPDRTWGIEKGEIVV